MVTRCWLVLAVLLAHSQLSLGEGAAPKPVPRVETEKLRHWKAAAVAALTVRADANSLATAAVLSGSGGPELATRASEFAPENAAIAWIRLRLCANTAGCDFRDAATALRWVDADNPAAWLPTLAAAQKDRDAVEVDRVLADMAQGSRFDLYWNPITVLMFDTLKSAAKVLPGPYAGNDASRLALVMGIANAKMIPSFLTLKEACRESTPGSPRRESCLKVALALQQGDTVIGQMAGLALEERFLPADGKEARTIVERRHLLEWRLSEAGKFDQPLLPWLKNAHARWRLARMRGLRREEDVVLAILREQGSPIYPPGEKR